MTNKNEWLSSCHHEFAADVTAPMKKWLFNFGANDHKDRTYYLQIYADGSVQLCDSTDGSAGIVFDLPDIQHCPMCGARYRGQSSTE